INEIETYFIFSNSSCVLDKGDIFWLIGLIQNEKDLAKQEKFLEVLAHLVDWDDPSHADSIFRLTLSCSQAADYFRWRTGPVELEGEMAQEMKRRYTREKSIEKTKREREINWREKMPAIIQQSLDDIEAAKPFSFSHLIGNLTAD